MSGGDPKGEFLYKLPASVFWEFCRVMDGLSELDWTRFASEVLRDQTDMRLAERKERRTDWVMNQWESRNGKVGELIDLLESLQLLRPRDIILCWMSSLKTLSSPPPPAALHPPPVSLSQFDPPAKSSDPPPTLSTCKLSTTVERPLPRPAPPPSSLQSNCQQPLQPPLVAACNSSAAGAGVMCWSFEELHFGTQGFSPSLQVGEGGFGVVYRATLRNTDCAVKKLKQDCLLDWTLLRESFQNEVDKLSKFRHPNIVDLLGFSEGGGTVCLIYSYMENRSVEDQLHNEHGSLSWSQRLAVVEGASAALQFLHSPPDRHMPLIHGDVKSSNILLDQHLVPKLADFGLARLACRSPSGRSGAQTVSVGKTATVRGTLAYLPDEYVRNGELSTAVDVYSFGVVLLEALTGRRALEKHKKSGERYLKDLVEEVEDSPAGSSAATWRKQLDHRLITEGAADPGGYLEVAALACRCLDKKRKKRPAMIEVFNRLRDIHDRVKKTNSRPRPVLPSTHHFPRPPTSLDSSVADLSCQLSKLGPLEGACEPSLNSQSSFSSLSSLCSLTTPHPLHSSSSLTTTSSTSSSSSSFAGPCETDESRGFSQYNICCQLKPNGTGSRSLSPSIRDQNHCPAGPTESQFSQPSVPTEDQYSFTCQPSSTRDRPSAEIMLGASSEPGTRRGITGRIPDYFSPAGSLQSVSSEPYVRMNPSEQHFLERRSEGRIQSPELLSSNDLYGGRSAEIARGPEESDELDYLPDKDK